MKSSKAGKTIGVFAKDSFPGEFCESWKAALKEQPFDKVDVGASIAYIMSPKEDSEVLTIKKACLVSIDVFGKYLKDYIMEIIDADKVNQRIFIFYNFGHIDYFIFILFFPESKACKIGRRCRTGFIR